MGEQSPFHPGEQAIQARVGVRERIEQVGRKVIRDYMPDQHREFFAQLPFLFVGSVDGDGRPWASVLRGEPGFARSPDPRVLTVRAMPVAGDPLAANLRDGVRAGVLGLEFHTRRRNRANGTIALDRDGGGFALAVEQSFGNCPQYINARQAPTGPAAASRPGPVARRDGGALDARDKAIIAAADTFFIASRYDGDAGERARGVDISHRGGMPGFVELGSAGSLIFPDFRGNFHFSTLGNLSLDRRAALLFIDFVSGTTVQMSGTAEIHWQFHSNNPAHQAALRLVSFNIEALVRIENALPTGWRFLSFAPQFHREPRT